MTATVKVMARHGETGDIGRWTFDREAIDFHLESLSSCGYQIWDVRN